jgi:energy-coupling factor transporter ATP-binding protein EcfA2
VLNKITSQVGELGQFIKQGGSELLGGLVAAFDTITGSASSVIDSASETHAEAMDWVKRALDRSKYAGAVTARPEDVARLAKAIAPVVWLLGKTGAGKSSIISALTGSGHAEIGSGFKPCTLRTQRFDLPAQTPIVRFLDTRGLEEPGYDPAEDIRFCESQAHLIIVAIKAADPSQEGVVATLQKIRKAQPEWPVIVVQTGLHSLYLRGADHPAEYAFDSEGRPLAGADVPRQLASVLIHQRSLFKDLKGPKPYFVPVDFTPADEGFTQTEYGKKALVAAILVAAPDSIKRVMRTRINQEKTGATDEEVRGAYIELLSAALAASGESATP